MNPESLRDILLAAPNDQLDHSLFPLIEKWEEPPTALQVLEVVDKCIHCALASGFALSALQEVYRLRLKAEGKTHEELVPFATWRAQLD